MNIQCQRQSALNELLNEAGRDHLETYPDTDPQALFNALDDTKSDALGLWICRPVAA